MKPHPSAKKSLRTRSLDLTALKQVQGGRGTWCGSTMHCDCGCSWQIECNYDFDFCPSCGAGC